MFSPKVLFPSGSTSWAILRASVVAMSTLHGTTTKLIVSLFSIKCSIRFLILMRIKIKKHTSPQSACLKVWSYFFLFTKFFFTWTELSSGWPDTGTLVIPGKSIRVRSHTSGDIIYRRIKVLQIPTPFPAKSSWALGKIGVWKLNAKILIKMNFCLISISFTTF